jgi:hypothetical protein
VPSERHSTVDITWGKGCLSVSGTGELDADAVGRLIRTLHHARREAFGTPPPTASVVEIVEKGDRKTDDGVGGIILPTDVRINGVSVFTTGGVKVHEIDLARRTEMATVTLTLPARRITVAAEGDL